MGSLDAEATIARLRLLLKKSNLKNFREKKKAQIQSTSNKKDDWEELLGIESNTVCKVKSNTYSMEYLELIERVGTCSNPSGSRSALARICTHFGIPMSLCRVTASLGGFKSYFIYRPLGFSVYASQAAIRN